MPDQDKPPLRGVLYICGDTAADKIIAEAIAARILRDGEADLGDVTGDDGLHGFHVVRVEHS